MDTNTSDFNTKIGEQLTHHIDNIKEENQATLNAWAINKIASTNCKALGIVQAYINDLPEFFQFYNNFKCTDDTNLSYVDSSFHQFWPDIHVQLYNKIVDNKLTITEDVLGFTEAPYIHLKLLMSRNFHNYYTKEYLNKALEHWEEYLNKHKNQKDLKYSLIASKTVWVAYILDKYSLIDKYSGEIIDSKYLPVSNFIFRLYGAIDYAFYSLGSYDKSLKLQRNHSLPLAKYIGNTNDIEQIKIRQGVYLYSLGKFEESKKVYEEIYNDNSEKSFYIFTNLGINYYRLGYSNKYISFQLKALNHTANNYKNILNVYRNLFLYYTDNKDINSALRYINKAKELATSNTDTTELALIDSYLGTFYWKTYKDHQKALHHLNSAQEILSSNDNYVKYIQLLLEKGGIYTKIDSLEKANIIFQKAKGLSLSKSDMPKYIDALVNLTVIDLKQNNLKEASKNLDEIKLYSLDNLDFPLLTRYYTVKAQYMAATGNQREAIASMEPVVEQVVDRAKNNTDSQEGYWSVEDEYLDAFELMVDLYMEDNSPGKALLVLDQLKTINDASLYNSPLVKAAKLTEQELAEEKRLNQRLQQLRKEYLNADEDNRFSIKTQIDRISAEREQILANVNIAADKPLAPLWKIQRMISNDELLLHFTELGSSYYISKITSDRVEIQKFDYPHSLQQKFTDIADELASGETNLHHLHSLYQTLQLDKISAGIKQVSVVPDQFIYRIPLEVIPTREPDSRFSFGSTSYMIEDYRFSYFTSLKELEDNRRGFTAATRHDFSAFAISDFSDFRSVSLPSLPFAITETENIFAALTSFSNKQINTGDAATKEAFKRNVSSSRMVHVATHSEVSEQDPLFSTIYLKGNNPSDTLESEQALYAYELFDTPLNSELIMLNSCSSGSGNYMQGTGIMGISRALRYAGAKSLALNLWSVNDKVAAEFAEDFYGYLNSGEAKNEAIRKAKINQLKQANANPHFWGAYMMIGNPSPVTSKNKNPVFLFSLLGATILLAGYSSYKSH